eukprot:jgi/Orpsp1_1/1182118/evm.model.c7180000079958.3
MLYNFILIILNIILIKALNSGDSYQIKPNLIKKYESNEPGYYLDSENTLIYYDANKECTQSEEINGYFLNSKNKKIIKCQDGNCELSEKVSCISNQVEVVNIGGILVLCYENSQEKFPTSSDEVKYYKLSNVDITSIFPQISIGSDLILLKMDQYSVTQFVTDLNGICVNDDYTLDSLCSSRKSKKYICENINKSCIIKRNTCNPVSPTNICNGYYFINKDSTSSEGTLYECKKDDISTCNSLSSNIRGYFKEIDIYNSNHKYIKCDGNSCIQINPPTSAVSKCNSIGELVLNNSEIKLCITSSKMVAFSSQSEETRYVIKNTEKNIFGVEENGDFIMISFLNNSIIPTDL